MKTMRSGLALLLALSLVSAAPGLGCYEAAAAALKTPVPGVIPAAGLPAPVSLPNNPDGPPLAAPGAAAPWRLSAAPDELVPGSLSPSIALPETERLLAPSNDNVQAEGPLSAFQGLSIERPAFDKLSDGVAKETAAADFDRRLGLSPLRTATLGLPTPDPSGGDASAPSGRSHFNGKDFVPASVRVQQLEDLAAKNPEAGYTAAVAALKDESDARLEIKLSALRILDKMPSAKVVPVLVEESKSILARKPKLLKESGRDRVWPLQREMLQMLGSKSAESGAREGEKAEVLELLTASYGDSNASVRLMAAWALGRFGVDPGPEKEPAAAARSVNRGLTLPPSARPGGQMPTPRNPINPLKAVAIAVGAVLGFAFLVSLMSPPSHAPVHPGPAASAQVQAGPSASAEKPKPPTAEESLQRIADDVHRSADAAERTETLIEKANAPKESNPLAALGGMMLNLFLMIGLPILVMIWLSKKMSGGMQAKAMTAAKFNMEKPATRFADVAGIDESLIEVQEIREFLQDPVRFRRMGARIPKGVLLKGPPGTGKTLMARALAGETNASFISLSGSDFVELFVGVGAARVRDLFEKAKANAPCIIFIDEIDGVARARGGASPTGGHDEREQTLNALLTAMDGFDNSSGVIVMAATNRPEVLDPAILRPGRFDRQITVAPPQVLGREAILDLHAENARLGPDASLRYVAKRTTGLSGAFLESVINEAAMGAVRRGADSIANMDLDDAVDGVTIGKARHLHLSEKVKRRIAVHEAGHILPNLLGPRPVPVNKFTIIPHGDRALGFAESGSEEGDKYLYEQEELEAQLDSLMGSTAAEKIVFGQWSTGPSSDIDRATKIVELMVKQLGMSPKLGFPNTAADPNNPFGPPRVSNETAREIDLEVRRILAERFASAEKLIIENRGVLDALVNAVLERETLTSDEIYKIVKPKTSPTATVPLP